jgi:hypothetical protein
MTDPIDRLLVNALHRPTTPDDACPDADAIGAYALGELGADDRAPIERHISNCRRCAAHVAQLVGLDEAAPTPARTAAARRSWLRWTWAVPAVVAVVVAAVWVAQPPLPSPAVRNAARVETGAPSMAPEVPPPVADTRPAETDRLQPPPARMSKPVAGRSVPSAAAAPPPASAAPIEERQERSSLEDKIDSRATGKVASQAMPVSPPPSPAPRAAEPEAARADAAGGREDAPGEKRRAAPASAKETIAPAGAVAGFAGDTAARAPIEVHSPVPAVSWRIVSGTIERTTDGGTTWRDDGAPAIANLRYGTAISEDVCWLATSTGTVLRRAADGTWTVTQVPGRPAVRAIEAGSALEATVTSVDGRVFATSDGGATWRETPRPR